MAEKMESVQVHLPPEQVRWLQARAVKHERSVSAELRSLVHFAAMAGSLLWHFSIALRPDPSPTQLNVGYYAVTWGLCLIPKTHIVCMHYEPLFHERWF
jgi:hypothetical protein